MSKKILIAEDIDSIGEGIALLLEKELQAEIHQARYCEEAYLKIRRAMLEEQPFDLLITDLSFKKDQRTSDLQNGNDLLAKLKSENITLNSIMYSIEDRPVKIRSFFNDLDLDGYVIKGRRSVKQLMEAVAQVYQGDKVYPAGIHPEATDNKLLEIDEYDIALLSELANGFSQEEIAEKFKNQGIRPASLSSIEKRLNHLKIFFNVRNTIQLIANAKDLGIV
ncbi:response regulator [Robertkochia solimangrovi]|uniref:response regulator n=1 Tax=Robertkochia solimangrovi TaxID=2213046 RepID=UPI00117CE4A2|nr:response regulator [Robertkochia solimangrovi]TRZ46231.1 response regulator [Robertkochia solimangrovi]